MLALLVIYSALVFARDQSTPELDRLDALYLKRSDPKIAWSAYEGYKALAANGDSAVLWRYAMASFFVAHRFTDDKNTQIQILKMGSDAGRMAATQDPKCAPCEFWTAINLARYGQTVGVWQALMHLSEVLSRLQNSIKIDEKYAGGAALRILGILFYKLPALLGGNNTNAEELLKKALEVDKKEALNYWALVQFYREETLEKEKALMFAKECAKLPIPEMEYSESRESYFEVLDWKTQLEAS